MTPDAKASRNFDPLRLHPPHAGAITEQHSELMTISRGSRTDALISVVLHQGYHSIALTGDNAECKGVLSLPSRALISAPCSISSFTMLV